MTVDPMVSVLFLYLLDILHQIMTQQSNIAAVSVSPLMQFTFKSSSTRKCNCYNGSPGTQTSNDTLPADLGFIPGQPMHFATWFYLSDHSWQAPVFVTGEQMTHFCPLHLDIRVICPGTSKAVKHQMEHHFIHIEKDTEQDQLQQWALVPHGQWVPVVSNQPSCTPFVPSLRGTDIVMGQVPFDIFLG